MKTPSQSPDLNDLISVRGTGGEIHQHAVEGTERLTTAQGVVIADNQNSLRAGAPGPTLLEDFAMREKIFHFATNASPNGSYTRAAMVRTARSPAPAPWLTSRAPLLIPQLANKPRFLHDFRP